MDIHLTHADGVPVYLQIINQLKRLIAAERLVPGQELPPIRVLAEELLINPNTVARAYRELEQAGWIFKKRGSGTFVAERGSPLSVAERRRIIEERLTALLVEAGQMDISVTELVSWLHDLADETPATARERKQGNV